jgi:hypothetical protein
MTMGLSCNLRFLVQVPVDTLHTTRKNAQRPLQRFNIDLLSALPLLTFSKISKLIQVSLAVAFLEQKLIFHLGQ